MKRPCKLLLHDPDIWHKLSAPGAATTSLGLGLGFLALGGLSAFSRASAASSAAFCRAAARSHTSFGSLPFEMSCSNVQCFQLVISTAGRHNESGRSVTAGLEVVAPAPDRRQCAA